MIATEKKKNFNFSLSLKPFSTEIYIALFTTITAGATLFCGHMHYQFFVWQYLNSNYQ